LGAAEKGGEQGCNLWRFQVPARDLPARAGLHGAARQRAGKGPLSTPSRACHTHGVSSGPGSGPGCRHVGGGGDGPGHVWPSCWGPLHGWAVLQARTPNMQPPPPHPASTRDEGACLPAWALYVDWRLYHYEYELPPVCLLGVAAVGVCRRSRHFFFGGRLPIGCTPPPRRPLSVCSSAGFCGSTTNHCTPSSCQRGWGACDKVGEVATTTAGASPAPAQPAAGPSCKRCTLGTAGSCQAIRYRMSAALRPL
jgi:hypothetical protein